MLQVILLLSAAALVGLDQGVKYLVSQTLAGQPPYVLIPGVFELHYSQNLSLIHIWLRERRRAAVPAAVG